jgi:peroxiredoxin
VVKKIFLLSGLSFFICLSAFANDTVQISSKPIHSIYLSGLNHKQEYVSLKDKQAYYLIAFLSPECPLCQNYSKDLNKLFEKYKNKIAFYGIIPGKAYSVAQVKKFRETFGVKFRLLFDNTFQLVNSLHATTTPQVYLVNKKNEIVYSGLIDNWAVSNGIKRTVVTEHYLEDAIFCSITNEQVKIKSTRPIGCLINSY